MDDSEKVITLSEEKICGIAADILEYASENKIHHYDLLASFHIIIQELAEKGIEIEIQRDESSLQ